MLHSRVAVGVLAAACLVARAQPLVQVSCTNNRVTMRDAQSGQLLLDDRGMGLYKSSDPAALAPVITFVPRPSGFDAVYKFSNTGPLARPLGEFAVAVLTLGPQIKWWDFRSFSTPQTATLGPTMYSRGYWYPGDLYSPVSVVSSPTHAVGVSLQYPILEYEHEVLVTTASLPGQYAVGEGGMGWMVCFTPTGYARGPSQIRPCLLAPGQQRTYTVSVRVTRNPTEWVRTLLPYRHYFRQLYGMVSYARWAAPWVGLGLADQGFISPANPSGWAYVSRRPDIHGWGPWVQHIQVNQGAYKHAMLWTPSGLYDQSAALNFPYQFTTRWLSHPNVAAAIDPLAGLPRIRSGGQVLGLWWGRSLQVATQWNPGTMQPFDIHNPTHVAASEAELALAVQAGAQVIGLDTFDTTVTPLWDQVAWLERMRRRAPGARFVTEPSSCDILHRLTPTLVNAWREVVDPQSPEDLYTIHHPNFLADFLLPGHETWATLCWDGWLNHFGYPPTAARMRQDVVHVASCGYAPVIFGNVPAPNQTFRARRTWETTVPADLRP